MTFQTGRFSRACTYAGVLGQGGFGRVYRACFGADQQLCAVKVIPARLRKGEAIEQRNDVWSGSEVFERLLRLMSPHVLRYYEYWVEEQDPQGLPAEASVAGGRGMPAPLAASTCSSPGAAVLSLSPPIDSDGFDWKYTQHCGELAEAAETTLYQVQRSKSRAEMDDKVFLYVRMEYCDGFTLHDWLYVPQKRFGQVPVGATAADGDLGAALALGGQLLQGVAALHEECIVHRDIKPANLLLERATGRLRILDFGLARMAEKRAETEEGNGGSGLQKRFSVAGSPGYAAPEQWGHTGGGEAPVAMVAAPPHPSADVFSAGVVFLELLVAALRQPEARLSRYNAPGARAGCTRAARGAFGVTAPLTPAASQHDGPVPKSTTYSMQRA
eukprot:CAMPEP_0180618814 /NCGR_PEP_ID=MMETSP1037_2-20121125/33767_1 /TAXON_ID=632150 /ORGANISM="Azadinium spinosum, Strain 3D9" /LENGTH=385 /DNA_ID=CAMNT_0022638851 /DNA_START=51 /DNA_END=1209 /DNA_ORIENTATION=-